ncbi:MAG: hypothetical protein KIS92_13300 [Planctomycetota bacterium]|nr:hypothetical protein [Planctomycetota bacterium]
MKTRILLLCAAWIAGRLVAAEMPDEERYDFEKELGPFANLRFPADPPGAKEKLPVPELDQSAGAAKTGKGALRFTYLRKEGRFDLLAINVPTTEMLQLEADVRTSTPGYFAIAVQDRDGARFNYGFELRNTNWRHLLITPDDFKLSDDSPVKKDKLDPERVTGGFALIDLSVYQKKTGINSLFVDNFVVQRKHMAVKNGGWHVTRDAVVDVSSRINGTLLIERGVTLTVKAKRFAVNGNIQLKDGATLRIEDAHAELLSAYNYQHNIAVGEKAKLELVRARMHLPVPWGVQLGKNAKAELEETVFGAAGFTFDVKESTTLSLLKTTGAGEAVIAANSVVRVNESAGILLWFAIPPGEPHRFEFPNGLRVDRWTAPSSAGQDAIVAGSQGIMWGLVPVDGCVLTVPGAELRTVGLFFRGNAPREVKGLSNNTTCSAETMRVGASRLNFGGSRIQTWNFYAVDKCELTVRECTFGEAVSFGDAKMVVVDATCDGSGGYFGAKERSQVTARNCKFVGRVIAHDEAKLVLEDCDIEGDAIAADRSSLTLINCKVTGRKVREPGAFLNER